MSEEIFFQNDNDDEFIDGWLKDAANVKGDNEEDLGLATEVRLGNDARNKFGLGFETGGANGSAVAQKEHNDALMERIKKRKLAAKEDRKNANKFEDEHGVIEDEMEGRAGVTSKASKFQKKSSAAASVAAGGKKAAKKSIVSESNKDNENNTKHNNTDHLNNTNTDNKNKTTEGDAEKPFIKRKRPKTRSKQKNIRRDKRDTAFMPEHLKVGSDKYTGRPLTEETKKYMGINK
jgi:hypothetical protein